MHQVILTARHKLRRTRDRWLDQTLLRVERARAEIVSGDADVLVLGESSCLAYAWADTDRTLIPDLLAERTGRRVVPVTGAGYDGRMFEHVLGALAGLRQRPRAVVLAINIRTNTALHVTSHPIHGHARSLAALERITPIRGRVRAFGRGGSTWRQSELDAFRAQEVATRWGGRMTIGEHLGRIEGRGEPPWPIEVERDRFDYFHGEVVGPEHPALASLAALGDRLAAYGVPAVAYWARPPMEYGESLFPGEFTAHVHANLERVESALDLEGHGFARLVRPAVLTEDHQDARNGTEHFAHSGRVKIAAEVAQALGR